MGGVGREHQRDYAVSKDNASSPWVTPGEPTPRHQPFHQRLGITTTGFVRGERKKWMGFGGVDGRQTERCRLDVIEIQKRANTATPTAVAL